VQEQAEARLSDLGLDAFEQEVRTADPGLAEQFEAGDRQRLLRAWSVWHSTGRALSAWQAEPKQGGLGAVQTFALLPDREALYDRINHRFAVMMEAGAMREVAQVAAQAEARGHDPLDLPLAQALGFGDLLAVQRGELSEAEAQARQATRNYAKRQLTWVRNQSVSAIKLPYDVVNRQEIERLSNLIVAFVSKKDKIRVDLRC